jgi:MFS superfamily sulfate permease-like transporter
MKLRPRSLLARAPDRKTVAKDAVSGIPSAIGSVPDGMASAVLAGVNPIHGLYASFAGPIAGGSTASTQRMVITTTTAAALSAGSALSNVPAGDRTQALFLMTVLTGAIMIVAGLLGRTVATSQVALVTTFLCTLLLPIAAAVGIGVAISLLLQGDREARDLAIVELEPTPEGDFVERPAPAQLRSDHVTLLGVYGSLYYAGSRTLQADLPDPA